MPKNYDVHVSLAKGGVQFRPRDGNVKYGKGNDTIIFKAAGNLVFAGKGIGFDDSGPFVYSAQDRQIVVIDQNRNGSGKTKIYE